MDKAKSCTAVGTCLKVITTTLILCHATLDKLLVIQLLCDQQKIPTRSNKMSLALPWLEKPGGGGTGRDLPLRAPVIPFPGWDPGGPNV